MSDSTFLGYFLHASAVVKLIMLILIAASVFSWSIILQRGFFLRRTNKILDQFEEQFGSVLDLGKLYADINQSALQQGVEAIFHAGFREFMRLYKQVGNKPDIIMEGVQRSLRIACAQQQRQLEKHLDFLATLGSTSPYIGLLGTVWGIMTSFQALSASQQSATIAMVAPGISEALVATAMGLFVAIPAVIFYNRYANHIHQMLQRYHTFQEEFCNILYRQIHTSSHV